MKAPIRGGLRSGELAAAAGVSADTLRHYEKAGVLPAPRRRPNGYREYPPSALDTVRLVRRGLAIGFTLSELAVFLASRRSGSPPCRRVLALASQRLAAVERQVDELTRFRDDFRRVLAEWSGRLAGTPDGSPARLLESLSAIASAGAAETAIRGQRFVNRRSKHEEEA